MDKSCECELALKTLKNFKINTGETDSREYLIDGNVKETDEGVKVAVKNIILYDELYKDFSLLDIAIEKVFGWKIGWVDQAIRVTEVIETKVNDDGTVTTTSQMANSKRSFDIDSKNVYAFLTQDVSKKFECIFDFNIMTRTIDTKISPVSEKVNAVESSVTNLSQKVETNTSDITALKTKTTDLEKADEAIRSTASEAKNTADILKQNIADYDSQFNTINGDITNIQADIDEIKKNPAASEYDVDYVGSTFSWMKNGEVLKTFTIQSGGGGGSDTSTITIERVTPADAIFLLGDKAEIEYTFSSVDNTGDTTGDGTAIWKVGNTIVSTTTASQGTNKVDLTEYLSVGSNQIRVSITDSFGTMSYKTWTVTIVEFKLESTFDDTLIYTDTDVVFRYTPYGNVNKTIHFILDKIYITYCCIK